ncbi:DNA polymerase III subunit gamma/tau [Coprothermobacteraceae bacterium]|nr:DNA polymerase III subunit gamma/tau [Coprothermobacteraceae bacterium]
MALYRKYRPQTFDEVVGQGHVTEVLKKALDNKQVSHAYLFAGPKGSGKTSCARIFAKGLNCDKGITSSPCNECDNCVRISNGSSLDVIEIDAASNRGIDEIRELRERVKYRPAHSRYKVYIIDEAHMLTREAFNALLKTLEEPPEFVVFILATTDPQKIPPTVLSRCQRFRFKKLTQNEVLQILKDISHKEGIQAEEEALELIAEVSEGAVRDALNLLEQVAVVDNGLATAKTTRFLLNRVEDEIVVSLIQTAVGDMQEAIEQLAQLLESGVEPMEVFRTMKYLVRRSVFSGKPWDVSTAIKMFGVLESYNVTMERTEFPAVALVAILGDIQKQVGHLLTNTADKTVKASVQEEKEPHKEERNQTQEAPANDSVPLGTQEESPVAEEAVIDLTQEGSWLEEVRTEYLPLYVVLKEGKARIEGGKIVLTFPGMWHLYKQFFDLPEVKAILRRHVDLPVVVEGGEEEVDDSVLTLFQTVFPGAKIEEVE